MCEQHVWGLADGLVCVGVGTPHAHVFLSSSVGDSHDVSEAESEASRG